MYKLLLCLRYLRTRYIALASIISVTLGVATMIVVNSVMAGFSTEMRERIHGLLADVIIETRDLAGASDAERQMQIVREVAGEHVAGMTTTVEVYGMLTFEFAGQFITHPVTLIGIHPEGKSRVGPLVDFLDSYRPVRYVSPPGAPGVLREETAAVAPARAPDETPGWELTAEARAWREEWKLRDQWRIDRIRHGGGAAESRGVREGPFSEIDAPFLDPFSTFEEDEDFERAEDGGRGESEGGSLPEPFHPGGGHNPFEGLGAPAGGPSPERQSDPAAPEPARLYVGMNLISFPFDEEGTGKVKTVMMARPGDDVRISTVSAGRPPKAVHFHATIVDVFKSGMSEYDSNLVFCNIEELQRVRGMIDPGSGVSAVTSIQIKLKDFERSREVVRRLQGAFPPGLFSVRTWEQKQGPLLAAVEVESAILNVLLFLIIAVAGFGILAIFFMIVVEKTRDIGILKALGAGSGGVMSIFLSYGLALGIVGSGVGTVLGLLFVRHINTIESWITWMTGRKVFDEKIYYFPEIPTSVSPLMVVCVALGAMTIAVLASVLPARRASRLRPVEALRYE